MIYAWNIGVFADAFGTNTLRKATWQNNFANMRVPGLSEIWEQLSACGDTIAWLGHAITKLREKIDWSMDYESFYNGLYEMIFLAIRKVQESEAEILEKIKQAIEVLDKKS